jgi:hypothetical protein
VIFEPTVISDAMPMRQDTRACMYVNTYTYWMYMIPVIATRQ